ncbi:hypothetical protein [Paenibacillus puerhi]|uniref:hypothetical protein n=1 Tax=Paenibacillus puerhi TaxID=2692622 RepID=UPI00135C9ED3|nr:hypothetical protein [Paenibacillus puerhi]
MPIKSRIVVGSLLIIAGIFIAVFYYNINKTYKVDELPDDIIRRIYASADGKKNVTNIQIQQNKKVGKYLVFLYSYDYKNMGDSNDYIIYEEHKNKYKVQVAGKLAFKLKDSKHNKGLQYVMLDGYLIMSGIINQEDVDTFEIASGDTRIVMLPIVKTRISKE